MINTKQHLKLLHVQTKKKKKEPSYRNARGFKRGSFRFLYLYVSQTPKIWNNKQRGKIGIINIQHAITMISTQSANIQFNNFSFNISLYFFLKLHLINEKATQMFGNKRLNPLFNRLCTQINTEMLWLTSVKLKNKLVPPTKCSTASAYSWNFTAQDSQFWVSKHFCSQRKGTYGKYSETKQIMQLKSTADFSILMG